MKKAPIVGAVKMCRCAVAVLFLLSVLLVQAASAGAAAFSAADLNSKQLLEKLEDDNWKYRLAALAEVATRQLMQGVDRAVELAQTDEQPRVRLEALKALEKMDSSWLLPTAEHMVVEDSEASNRRVALEVLRNKAEGSRMALVLASVVAGDRDAGMRLAAVQLLIEKKWRGAEKVLARSALRDGSSDVRRESRRALVVLGGEEHRSALHRVLRDEPNKKFRLEIAELIEGAPIQVDRNALLAALDDRYSKVAISAARALARLGDRSVAGILRQKAGETRDGKRAASFNEAAAALED